MKVDIRAAKAEEERKLGERNLEMIIKEKRRKRLKMRKTRIQH